MTGNFLFLSQGLLIGCLLELSVGTSLPVLPLPQPDPGHSADNTKCPEGWVGPHRNSCYKLSTEFLSWDEANSRGCRDLESRAHLAAVTNSNKAFLSKQTELFAKAYYPWVGLRSGDAEWNKNTASAKAVDYTNWETIDFVEPSGSEVTGDDCVMVTGANTLPEFLPGGKWVDWKCTDKNPFLCELRQDSECPSGWQRFNDICYQLNTAVANWKDAIATCKTAFPGAHLATAAFDVNDFPDTLFFWIALRSTPDDQGDLHWSNDEAAKVQKTHWHHLVNNEPNGLAENKNDCVVINGMLSAETFMFGDWADIGCAFKNDYLCELQLDSKPQLRNSRGGHN